MTKKEDFLIELTAQIERAIQQKRPHAEINAGELHRVVGGYPSKSHSMPTCCEAMKEEMERRGGIVVFKTDSGNSASYTVRYSLNTGD
jgi:5-methylcytosine-specific restriction protein A